MAKRTKSSSALISSLLLLTVGILMVVFRSATLQWAMTFVGAVFILSGLLDIARRNTVGGAVGLIVGIAILVLGWTVTQIVLLVLGVIIAFKGIVALFEVMQRKKPRLGEILFPILTVVLGLVLAFGNGLDYIIFIIGVLLIADGVVGLIGCIKK